MSSMYPVSGAFSVFGTRFVSPALGFTLGMPINDRYSRIKIDLCNRMELLAAVESFHSYVEA